MTSKPSETARRTDVSIGRDAAADDEMGDATAAQFRLKRRFEEGVAGFLVDQQFSRQGRHFRPDFPALAAPGSGSIGWFVVMSGQAVGNVVFWRCLFGAITLLIICAVLGLLNPRLLSLKSFGIAVFGGVAIVLNWLLLFASYSHASISIATTVYNTQPFMLLALGAAFLGEKITGTKLFWACLRGHDGDRRGEAG